MDYSRRDPVDDEEYEPSVWDDEDEGLDHRRKTRKRRRYSARNTTRGQDPSQKCQPQRAGPGRRPSQDPSVKCLPCLRARTICDQAQPTCSACMKTRRICRPQGAPQQVVSAPTQELQQNDVEGPKSSKEQIMVSEAESTKKLSTSQFVVNEHADSEPASMPWTTMEKGFLEMLVRDCIREMKRKPTTDDWTVIARLQNQHFRGQNVSPGVPLAGGLNAAGVMSSDTVCQVEYKMMDRSSNEMQEQIQRWPDVLRSIYLEHRNMLFEILGDSSDSDTSDYEEDYN